LPRGDRSSIAARAAIAVIYYMIARQMNARTSTAHKATGRFTKLHWVMTIVGIATAIVCSLVLLSDIQPTQNDAAPTIFMNTSNISTVGKITRVTELNALSIMEIF
jgi:hypothetical protein